MIDDDRALKESNFKHCFGDLPIQDQILMIRTIKAIEKIIK